MLNKYFNLNTTFYILSRAHIHALLYVTLIGSGGSPVGYPRQAQKKRQKGKKETRCKPPQVERERAGVPSVDWIPFYQSPLDK